MRRRKLTILFSGMLAGVPHQGGATWAVLQYVLGLRRLGHDVALVEPVDTLASGVAEYFHQVVTDFSLAGRAALLVGEGRETIGIPFAEIEPIAKRADVLINVSGMLQRPELFEPAPRRVYLDLDPAFVQLWHAAQGIDMRFAGHTHFVTVGLRLGEPE